MYRVTIRQTNGAPIAEGRGQDWRATAARVYRAARPHRGNHVALAHWFPTDHGAPIGTWHVQFGRGRRSVSLDPLVVVRVDPA